MARTLVRGSTQIMGETITNDQIRPIDAENLVGIELAKIEKGTSIVLADGTAVAGDINLDGNKIYGSAVGVNPTDLVTKSQLDSVSAGLDAKGASHVATTGANIDLSTGGLLTIDGEVLTAGQRVLVKDQTIASENGVYDAAVGSWTRSADFDGAPTNEVSGGSFSFVTNGTVNGGTGWIVVAEGDIVVGTDDIVWTQFSGASTISGGNGITVSGTIVSADVDGTTIVNTGGAGDKIGVADAGITATQLAASVAGDGLAGGAGTALSIDLDGATLTVATAGIKVSDAGITETQIASSALSATGGLTGGSGTTIGVNGYWGVTVDANGVGVDIDGTTLALSAAGVKVADGGITATQLAVDSVTAEKINADVAGLGLISNATTGALDINVDDSTIGIVTDVLQVKAGGITETEINSSALGTGLTGGSGTTISVDASAFLALTDLVTRENQTANVDGVTAVFTLANPVVAGTEHVYVNGVLMEDGGNDYSIVAATGVITFEFVPKYNAGNADKTDKIVVTYFKVPA